MLAAARDAAGPLLRRDAETELLTSLLDGIERSGSALVLRGEPGIGKSRLLAEVAGLARARDIAVLSATGVQSERRAWPSPACTSCCAPSAPVPPTCPQRTGPRSTPPSV